MNLFSTPDLPHGLAAGTLVTTPDGAKKIEDVKAGDLVLSGVGGGFSRFCKVEKSMSSSYQGPMLRVETESGHELRATPNHICFARPHNLIEIVRKNRKESILLIALTSSPLIYINYYLVPEETYWTETFNHIDLAEEAAHQISLQNGGLEIKRAAGFITNEGFLFMPATDLKVAMQVPVAKNETVESATITNITEEQYDGLVYDLDIPETRNFAANGVLVHDSTRF